MHLVVFFAGVMNFKSVFTTSPPNKPTSDCGNICKTTNMTLPLVALLLLLERTWLGFNRPIVKIRFESSFFK